MNKGRIQGQGEQKLLNQINMNFRFIPSRDTGKMRKSKMTFPKESYLIKRKYAN